MSIFFVVDGGSVEERSVKVSYEKAYKSEYIKHLVDDVGITKVSIPVKYNDIISNYIDFLHGKFIPIYDRQYLKQCFGAAISPSGIPSV